MGLFEEVLTDELRELAEELGIEIEDRWRKPQIQKAIREMEDFSENLVEKTLAALRAEKIRQEEREEKIRREEHAEKLRLEERAEKLRLEEAERAEKLRLEEAERAEKIREAERAERIRLGELEVEKLRVMASSTPAVQVQETPRARNAFDIRKLVPVFDAQVTDIQLFLSILEKHLRAASVEEECWVTQLLTVLPFEVAQIVLQEGGENTPSYAEAKQVLLGRFRLTPEAFRQKFAAHTRRGNSRWKEFAFELQEYLAGWLDGLAIESLEDLKKLMIADQIKRRAPSEAKTHFIDLWGEIKCPWVLADKLDKFELVRLTLKKTPSSNSQGNWRSDKNSEQNSKRSEPKTSEAASKKQFTPEKVGKTVDRDLEIKKEPGSERKAKNSCWNCNETSHFRNNCPYLKENIGTEQINRIWTSDETEQSLEPYTSDGRVNGRKIKILRDSGATCDFLPQNYVEESDYTGQTVSVSQPLAREKKILRVARVTLEGYFGKVKVNAAVLDRNLDRGIYILGNKTAKLIQKFKSDEKSAVGTETKTYVLSERARQAEEKESLNFPLSAGKFERRKTARRAWRRESPRFPREGGKSDQTFLPHFGRNNRIGGSEEFLFRDSRSVRESGENEGKFGSSNDTGKPEKEGRSKSLLQKGSKPRGWAGAEKDVKHTVEIAQGLEFRETREFKVKLQLASGETNRVQNLEISLKSGTPEETASFVADLIEKCSVGKDRRKTPEDSQKNRASPKETFFSERIEIENSGSVENSSTKNPRETEKSGTENSGNVEDSGTKNPGNTEKSGTENSGNVEDSGTKNPGNTEKSGTETSGNVENSGTKNPGNTEQSGTETSGNVENSGTKNPGKTEKLGTENSGNAEDSGAQKSGTMGKSRPRNSGIWENAGSMVCDEEGNGQVFHAHQKKTDLVRLQTPRVGVGT